MLIISYRVIFRSNRVKSAAVPTATCAAEDSLRFVAQWAALAQRFLEVAGLDVMTFCYDSVFGARAGELSA